MSSTPARELEPLQRNRRLVAAASLTSGVVGLLPVPLANDLAIGAVRAFLVRAIARRHGVELTNQAILQISGESQPSLGRLALTTLLAVSLRLAMRRLTRALLVIFRFDDVGRTFLLGTIFDYYCLYHRRGAVVDEQEAEALQRAIGSAITRARERLISTLFHKVLSELQQAGTRMPSMLWTVGLSMLSSQETEQVERQLEQDAHGFYRKITSALERHLSAAGRETLVAVCEAFDDAWELYQAPSGAMRQELTDESDNP